MPYVLLDLDINRVDLVDEGCNSAAFIELFKRKGLKENMDYAEIISKMKPEHAEVIQKALDDKAVELAKANEDLKTSEEALTKAKTDLEAITTEVEVLKAKKACECDGEADEENVCKKCGLKKAKNPSFDEEETLLKSMPQAAIEAFEKLKTQKEAAESEIRKAKEEKDLADAEAKADVLKALPIERAKLVEICKGASPDVIEVLTGASAAIEAAVLGEIGKGRHKEDNQATVDAWEKIEKAAAEIATRDNITKQKAVAVVMKEQPDLYRDYLNGGGK